MSGLARLLVEMGCVVSGSDARESPVLDQLRGMGVDVRVGHDASFAGGAQFVLWSPAVGPENPELLAARQRGAMLLARPEVLAELGRRQRVVGLTGTHGKTTATSMMVQVLHAAHRDDSRLLGADVIGVGPNGHYGHDDLVLEVDESYGTFALLEPWALGLLNVEADHLDFYGSLDVLEGAFASLLERTAGPVVVWSDDPGARRVGELAGRDVVRVGTIDADWMVSEILLERRRARFVLRHGDENLEVGLSVTGAHNVANAAVVAVLARSLGVEAYAIVQGLGAFAGAPRRFDFRGRWRGVDVYEDYAHLPGEIAATVAATRAAGYERITVAFQPHRVTRTVNLADEFAHAFTGVQYVVVSDIYTAGEANPTGVTGELIASKIHATGDVDVTYAGTFDRVLEELERLHGDSDVVLLLGAGDIADLAPRLSGGLN